MALDRKEGGAAVAAGIGLALGAAAVANALAARSAERRHPPQGRFLTVGGVRLHYREAGPRHARPVILLHGNGAMAEDFVASGLYERLAARYRVIAFDRPGFGFSDRPRSRIWTPTAQAELLAAAVCALGADRAIVLGHSWGAMVALAMGLDRPSVVAGLVLASGYYFPSLRPEVPLFAVPAIPILGDVARYTVSPPISRAIAPRLVRRIFAPQRVPPRFTAGFPMELALRPSQLRASAAETALMVPSAAMLQGRYPELVVPTTIIAGTGDRIVDFDAQSARLHAATGGSRMIALPHLGHMIHYFAHAALLDAIEQLAGPRRVPAARVEEASRDRQPAVPTSPGVS